MADLGNTASMTSSSTTSAVSSSTASALGVDTKTSSASSTTDEKVKSSFSAFYKEFILGLRRTASTIVGTVRNMNQALEDLLKDDRKFAIGGLLVSAVILAFVSNYYLYHMLMLRKIPFVSELLSLIWYLPFIIGIKVIARKLPESFTSKINDIFQKFHTWISLEENNPQNSSANSSSNDAEKQAEKKGEE